MYFIPGTSETVSLRTYSKKTSEQVDRSIVRWAKSNPLMTAVDINKEPGASSINITPQTVRRRLVEAGFHGLISRRNSNENLYFSMMKQNIESDG
ncbi:hypothetical protein Trydic_g23954 [Trypoxylus dichotomus]